MADGTKHQLPPILELDAGRGLLSARAIWASVVGPQRLAMSPRKAVKLTNTEGAEIYKALGAANGYVLVGVALPFNASPNPLTVVFGRDQELGFNQGLPVRLTDNQLNWAFTQLLLPGEQLFAQIMTNPGPPIFQNVVVAAAIF